MAHEAPGRGFWGVRAKDGDGRSGLAGASWAGYMGGCVSGCVKSDQSEPTLCFAYVLRLEGVLLLCHFREENESLLVRVGWRKC